MKNVSFKRTLQISDKKNSFNFHQPERQVLPDGKVCSNWRFSIDCLSLPSLWLTSLAPINRCKFTGPRSSSPRTTCSSPIFRPGLKRAKWSLITIAWQLTMRYVKVQSKQSCSLRRSTISRDLCAATRFSSHVSRYSCYIFHIFPAIMYRARGSFEILPAKKSR